jgi:hypothetical protein
MKTQNLSNKMDRTWKNKEHEEHLSVNPTNLSVFYKLIFGLWFVQ